MNTRVATVLLCAAVSTSAALWLTRDASLEILEQRSNKSDLAERQRNGASWQESVTYTPVRSATPIDLNNAIQSRIDDGIGSDLANKGMKASLASSLSQELLARAQGPIAYLSHADAAPGKWISPTDEREWHLIECYVQGTGSPVPSNRTDPRTSLDQIVHKAYQESHPSAWANDPSACAVVFYRAASEEQLFAEGYEQLPQDFIDRMFIGSGHNAIRTRWPDITGLELLRRDRSVLCALAIMLVQTADEDPYTWQTRWVWDPHSKKWHCDNVSRNGNSRHTMFY